MPLHDFRCEKCGKKFEHLLSKGETPPPCPFCGHEKVLKQLSAFAVGAGDGTSAGDPQMGCGRCADTPGCRFRE